MNENYLSKTDSFFTQHIISTNWLMDECHFHDGYEIYLSCTDGIQFFVNDKVYSVNKGDILVFNHLDLHRAMIPKGIEYERYYLILNPKYISDISTDNTNLLGCFEHDKKGFCYCVHLNHEDEEELIRLFNNCENYIYHCDEYGYDVNKKISLIKILLFINKCYLSSIHINHLMKGGYSKLIRNIQKYISQNLSEDLSLDYLEKKFYISKRHLQHIFKEYCGFSVGEYITTCRIIKARELLRMGLPVSHVGEQVGYPNPSHFSRIFKQNTGVSPKKYSLSATDTTHRS